MPDIKREAVEKLREGWQHRSENCKSMSDTAFESGDMTAQDVHWAWHACCEKITADLTALLESQ